MTSFLLMSMLCGNNSFGQAGGSLLGRSANSEEELASWGTGANEQMRR